jgi:hypothetical protein
MITMDVVEQLIGADALDLHDDRIGEVGQVYVDERSEHPTWVSVRLGLLSGAEVLVPLDEAELDERGSLHLAVDRQVAREAPRKEMDEPLTVGEEERLYTHYGIPTLRHPRSQEDLLEVDADDICYSIHDVSTEDGLQHREELSRAS